MRKALGSLGSCGVTALNTGALANGPSATLNTRAASDAVKANTDTQSRLLQAGRTPRVGTRPGVGLRPTRLLKPAGTRPEPAVSVPNAKGTSPRATTTAEPEL